MDYQFSEEHKMLQKAIKDFGQKEIAPLVAEAEKNAETPVQLYPKMGKLGYLCPIYPPEYGGGGLGEIGSCIMVEELARVSFGIVSGFMVQTGLATHAIFDHGTEEQKQKFLVPACEGRKIAAYGLTEPNAGSDAASIQTTARRDGKHWVINGTKMFITNGNVCDYVTLAVMTDKSKGSRGISSIIVEKGTPGFTANKLDKLGQHSCSTAELVFEDCRVPAENLVGEEGKGFKYMMEALNIARITHSARSVGVAQAALEATLSYAKERVQFGHPIGKNQAIAFKIANMAVQIEAARNFLYRVAWQYDQGDQCRREGPMLKYFCSETAIRAAEDSMRIHSGAGYLAESVAGRIFCDSILTHITEGTSEIQLLMIAGQLGLMD